MKRVQNKAVLLRMNQFIYSLKKSIKMKKLQSRTSVFHKILALISITLLSTVAWAQDKGIDIDVDLDKGNNVWYGNPIVWVIGGAVFILLLVALIRGGSKQGS